MFSIEGIFFFFLFHLCRSKYAQKCSEKNHIRKWYAATYCRLITLFALLHVHICFHSTFMHIAFQKRGHEQKVQAQIRRRRTRRLIRVYRFCLKDMCSEFKKEEKYIQTSLKLELNLFDLEEAIACCCCCIVLRPR